eukprot:c17512_g1_i3.p1 GENE.c17512_g1_i3~~c17512_g1_i3.p1  ORF type:complete len:459 (-),score=148.06 c17512_g1_i3:74-1450(-)
MVTILPDMMVAETEEQAKARQAMIVSASVLFSTAIFLHLLTYYFKKSSVGYQTFRFISSSFLYFSVSITLILYNKWMLKYWQGGFQFPLLMTFIQLIMKVVLSCIFVTFLMSSNSFPKFPWSVWILYAIPVGVTTALDIGMSNQSFIFISVSFYTIVKTSSLVFILLFSILFEVEKPSLKLLIIVLTISFGIAVASYGEMKFVWEGFLLCVGASFLAGFRWSLTQILMKKIGAKLSALLTVYMISPASALTLLPFWTTIEGKNLQTSPFFQDTDLTLTAISLVFGGSFLAFALIFVELDLISQTSSLTFGVTGYIKEILQIFFAVIIFQDQMTLFKILGITIAMIGAIFYTLYKSYSLNSLPSSFPLAKQKPTRFLHRDEKRLLESQLRSDWKIDLVEDVQSKKTNEENEKDDEDEIELDLDEEIDAVVMKSMKKVGESGKSDEKINNLLLSKTTERS